MKITNAVFEALLRNNMLEKMMNSTELPVKISYQLSRLARFIDIEKKIFHSSRITLLEKYCVKDDKGVPVLDPQKNYVLEAAVVADFNKEFLEFLGVEIEIPMDKIEIKLSEIPKGLVSPAQFSFLECFFTFEE